MEAVSVGPIQDPAQLAELLAAEVILRVAAQAERKRLADRTPDPEKISALEAALRGDNDAAAEALMRTARLAGMPAEALYYGLLAPAVKGVGAAWMKGEFALPQMVLASNRVWRILRELRHAFVPAFLGANSRQAVFALCPEECHTIGLTMTADDLRRRGWDVDLLVGYSHDELLDRMDQLAPTTVALAATMSDQVLPLARLVVALRAHLPGVWVMVGGAIADRVDGLMALTGADAVANSADEAERLIDAHLAELAERRVNRF